MARPDDPGPTQRWVLPGDVVAALCFGAGWRGEDVVTAIAIARAESGFDAYARNYAAADSKWGPAVGLFQVRVLNDPPARGADARRDLELMLQPEANAQFAYDLSRGGRTWSAWTAYTSGAYRQYLDEARELALDPAAGSPRDPRPPVGGVPVVDNDWIDEDHPVVPVQLEGAAHPGDLGNAVVGGVMDLSMAESSQLTLVLEDEGTRLLRGGDVVEGVPVRFRRQRLIVTSVGVEQGPGSPHARLEAQPAGVVRLRGVTPAPVHLSPVAFARRLAKAAGMRFAGGPPAAAVDIAPAEVDLGGPQALRDLSPSLSLTGGTRKENAWELLQRLARESQHGYVCFEAGGTLYFATQDWLFRNAGTVVVQVGSARIPDPRARFALRAIGYPAISRVMRRDRFNHAYRHVEAEIELPPGPGWAVRPGLALWLAEPAGLVDGARPMLVTSVRFDVGDRTKPVRVKAASYSAPGDVQDVPASVPDAGDGSPGSGTSQNGWPASRNPGEIGVTSWPVPGTGVRLQVAGRAAGPLLHVAREFHRRVERLIPDQCGAYNYRTIAGSSTLSNHASGTAVDLNWSRHPRGSRTFSADQVAEIRAIVRECKGVVVWGGEWGNPDEMHFEIQGDPATVGSRFG